MNDNQKEDIKVSLIFYSEEEGKRVKMDKWNIEIGKKYTIGRSKKKVDISIQDITISRVQAEFIFYDKNKIMIKDFNSSNGTYINKIKIDPYLEVYFSYKDILSIGDEKNEFVFEVSKEIKTIKNQEKNKREDFDEVKQKIKNQETKEKTNILKKIQKNSSKSYSKNSSYEEYKKEKNDLGVEDKYEKFDEKYNREKEYKNEEKYFNKNMPDKGDYKTKNEKIFDKEDKYEKNFSFNRYNYRKEDNYKNEKRDNIYIFKKKEKSNENNNIEKEEKYKYKNINSYIIKNDNIQEEEIERENNKRQIALYSEYLNLKKEREENNKKLKLPPLLPILVLRSEEEESSYGNEEENQEDDVNSSEYRPKIGRNIKRMKIIDNYRKPFIGIKRKGEHITRFRRRKIKRSF